MKLSVKRSFQSYTNFQSLEKKWMFPKSFCATRLNIDSKTREGQHEQENYWQMSVVNINAFNSKKKIISKSNLTIHKRTIHHKQVWSNTEMQEWLSENLQRSFMSLTNGIRKIIYNHFKRCRKLIFKISTLSWETLLVNYECNETSLT